MADDNDDLPDTDAAIGGETAADDPAEIVVTDGASDADGDIADLSYEAARDELVTIVSRLEGGSAGLEESMQLWDRGEKLAAHCQKWLDSAEQRLDASAGTDKGDS